MKELKIAFGIANILRQNTPKVAQYVGDAGLLLAGIAALPLLVASFGVTVPAILTTVATYAVAGGIGVKKVSKMFGIVDAETGKPVEFNVPTDATQVIPLFKTLFQKLKQKQDGQTN